MSLHLVEKPAIRRGSGSVPSEPFAEDPGFTSNWWTRSAYPSPLWFTVIEDAGHPDESPYEAARVVLVPNSNMGLGYRGWRVPKHGSTEIDRLEVRTELRHRGYGTQVLRLLIDQFPVPFVALPTDAHAAGFWRRVGWEQLVHREGMAHRLPLFTYPARRDWLA